MRRIGLAVALALGIALAPPAEARPTGEDWRIDLLQHDTPHTPDHLREGLRQLGYSEGRNITIQVRYAEGRVERLPGLATDLKEEIPPTLEPSTGSVPPGYSSQIIHVKFREGIQVDAPETLLPVDLRDSVATITRLFSLPEHELKNIRRKGETRSGRRLPNLNLWFQITLKPDVAAARFLGELKRLNSVESAQLAPLPSPPPLK